MRIIPFLFFLCFLLSESLISQNDKADELRLEIKNARHDTIRIIKLCDLCHLLSENEPKEAITVSKEAVQLAVKIGNQQLRALALMNLGDSYRNDSEYEKALECFSESKTIYHSIGDEERVLMVALNEAILHWNRGDYDKCIKMELEVLMLAEKQGYPKMQANSSNNIGLAYTDKGEYKKAISYFERALVAHRKNKLADSANVYQNLGNCYYYLKNTDLAGKYYATALELYGLTNDVKGKMRMLSNMGNIKLDQNNLTDALALYKQAITMAELLNDKVQIASTLGNMSYIYSDLGDFKKANDCCEKALAVSRELKSKKLLEGIFFIYSDACVAAKDFNGAYKNLLASWWLRDSIFNEERDQSIREMETKYETEKKDAQIQLLNSEKEKQFLILLSIISGLMLVIIFSIALYRRFRIIRNQKQIIEMQKHVVEEKQKEILDSIHYAKRIQNSLLPTQKYISKKLHALIN